MVMSLEVSGALVDTIHPKNVEDSGVVAVGPGVKVLGDLVRNTLKMVLKQLQVLLKYRLVT